MEEGGHGSPLPQQVHQSFAASLRNLRTNYLDCLILHSPLASPRQTQEVWRAMESLAIGGDVRQLGISNCYSLEQLKALFDSARIKPVVVQNRLYADTGYDGEIRAYCKMQRIVYQSFWTLTANPHVLAHATIAVLAKTYRRTPAQITIRSLFPAKPPNRDRNANGCRRPKYEYRRDRRIQAQAAPGHRIQSVDRPACRQHERSLLQPLGKYERGHPGAAHHHQQQIGRAHV